MQKQLYYLYGLQLFHPRAHNKNTSNNWNYRGKSTNIFQLLKRKIHGILQQCNNEKRSHITPVCVTMNMTHLFPINKPHELSCRFGTPGCAIHTNSFPNLVARATARDPRPFLRQSCNIITNSNNKYSVNSYVITESKKKRVYGRNSSLEETLKGYSARKWSNGRSSGMSRNVHRQHIAFLIYP
jgi:hypothetical protein